MILQNLFFRYFIIFLLVLCIAFTPLLLKADAVAPLAIAGGGVAAVAGGLLYSFVSGFLNGAGESLGEIGTDALFDLIESLANNAYDFYVSSFDETSVSYCTDYVATFYPKIATLTGPSTSVSKSIGDYVWSASSSPSYVLISGPTLSSNYRTFSASYYGYTSGYVYYYLESEEFSPLADCDVTIRQSNSFELTRVYNDTTTTTAPFLALFVKKDSGTGYTFLVSTSATYFKTTLYADRTYKILKFCRSTITSGSTTSSTFSDNFYVQNYPTHTSDADGNYVYYDASTRMSYLSSAINTYNTSYNYTDDSEVVNYYIGTLDESTNEYNIYNINLYDEDTLIFTEPVTETQYQTTGWTYDYTTRTYTLDLDSGTFYIGDYDIDTIDLTYGDDELTITYYSNDTAIATDEYAYLMVSQSECSLNGHTYSLEDYQAPTCGEAGYYDYVCSVCGNEYLETIDATGEHSYEYSIYQDPTCTAEGTGLYTCSVCGNQYTEPIAATGHSYEYSIYQEPTCTATGIGIYTCSECGDQYTETIDPTGHTAEIVEYVATEYDENGTATTVGYTVYECSVCGTQWTETDEIDVQSEGWFATISSLFKTLISALVNGLADGLNYLIENVIVSITDFVIQIVQWLFNLIDFDYLTSWFSWFDDNEVLDEEFGTSGDSYDVWNYS